MEKDTPGKGAAAEDSGVTGGGLLESFSHVGRLECWFFRGVMWLDFCQPAECPGHDLCSGLCSQSVDSGRQ